MREPASGSRVTIGHHGDRFGHELRLIDPPMTSMWCYGGVVIRAVVDTNLIFEGLTHVGPSVDVIDTWVADDFHPSVSMSTALAHDYQGLLGLIAEIKP